jgi:hypothetical protein
MQVETVAAPHLVTTPIPGDNRDVHAADAVTEPGRDASLLKFRGLRHSPTRPA